MAARGHVLHELKTEMRRKEGRGGRGKGARGKEGEGAGVHMQAEGQGGDGGWSDSVRARDDRLDIMARMRQWGRPG